MDELFETNPDFTCKYDMRRCTVNGRKMYCTKERIADKDMPDGWHKAEVRSSDHSDEWSTIEPSVAVNHAATLVSDRPFKFIDRYNVRGCIHPYIRVTDYDVDFDPDLDEDGEEKTTYSADGIEWDCDGVPPEECSLPQSDIIEAESEDCVADRLADKYGFCVAAIEKITELS